MVYLLTDSTSPKELRRLAKIKQLKKKQKPSFVAQNSWRFLRVDSRWRRPRGIDSSMREKLSGHPRMVNIGYRKPKLLRDMHYTEKNGLLEEFIVSNLSDLDLVLPHKHIVRIDGNLGTRKKEKLFQEALSWGLKVINPIKAKEEFDDTNLTEDLSLDREMSLDLDLEDVEDAEDAEDVKDSDEKTD